jgi:P27 family predicted phage terminase small subunit
VGGNRGKQSKEGTSMARPRLSEEHHKLIGTPIIGSKAQTESNLAADEPRMPGHLTRNAKREWKRILPMLLERRSLTEGDATALALYCETYSRWLAAKNEVAESGITIETTVLDKHGAAILTRKTNPALRTLENCERSLRSLLLELGLTPRSRERVLPAKAKEEKEEGLLQQMQRERGETVS